MKNAYLLIFVLLCGATGWSQTHIGGQLNHYASFISQDDCRNTITVDNAIDFTPGMGIFVIQMTGANINLSNTDSFGDMTDLNGTGQYEYNRIVAIQGNDLTLELALVHTYPGTGTQVVGFPILAAANVTSPLVPQAWNGITGGVIALEVTNTLTITADIEASGSGFRGGQAVAITDNNCSFLTAANNYAYEQGNWRGAPKGEGIALTTVSRAFGRGAQANGGGGGNDHNSGGGGGSLLTTGGQGGQNNEPGAFNCDGNFPGRGGKVVFNANNRLFMGGGGGAGHSNNTPTMHGGNGGGIILLKVGTIEFAGGRIRANGTAGGNAAGDGAGGGGAGGMIVLVTNSSSGVPQLEAIGGAGGTANNSNQNRCFGPGGGGSGGVVWSNTLLAPAVGGGIAGTSINSQSCPVSTNGATAGSAGLVGTLTNLQAGSPYQVPAILNIPNDTLVCPGEQLLLVAVTSGTGLAYRWQRLVLGSWLNVPEDANASGTQTPELLLRANAQTAGTYRLAVTASGCSTELVSTSVQVDLLLAATANPAFILNGNTATFSANLSSPADVLWHFGNAQTSTIPNPIFTFPGAGSYPVSFSFNDGCGEQVLTLLVTITEPLQAGIGASSLAGCAPLVIRFQDESVGNVTLKTWSFPGGSPASSTEATPLVTYPDIGTYTATLRVGNGGANSAINTQVSVFPPPIPNFAVTTDALTISLSNTSTNATSFLWNFGDGNSSSLESPVHTYDNPGVYEVTLNASNEYCGVAVGQTIGVFTNSNTTNPTKSWRVYPNPFWQTLTIEHGQGNRYVLYNSYGQQLLTGRIIQPRQVFTWPDLPAGVYFLGMEQGGQSHWQKIVKF